MKEKEPHNQLPNAEDELFDESRDEFSEYFCPVCGGGGWAMTAFSGSEIIDLGMEPDEGDENEVYLVCPNCDMHFPEYAYKDYCDAY